MKLVASRLLFPVVFCFCALTSSAAPAFAQAEGDASFHGIVYDRRTLRPLAFAQVYYAEVFHAPGDGQIVGGSVNPATFDYQITVTPADAVVNRYLHAICLTRVGLFTGNASLPYALRPTEYKRDIYIELPEGIDNCLNPVNFAPE